MDLTIEESSRLKVIYGSAEGFHAVDLDSASVYDIYLPKHVRWKGLTNDPDGQRDLTEPLLFLTDSGCYNSTLYCDSSQLEWHATAAVLRQRRRLREHDRKGVQEHCASGENVGRDYEE